MHIDTQSDPPGSGRTPDEPAGSQRQVAGCRKEQGLGIRARIPSPQPRSTRDMATTTLTLPKPRRRPRNSPWRAAGRACFPDIYFVKPIDNSRLRREVDPKKRRECYSLLGLGVLVFLFVLLFARQHFQCVQYGYQIEQLKKQRAELEEWNHQLRLEQASLADPQRIDTRARKELGLAPPGPQQVIRIGPASAGLEGNTEFARNLSTLAPATGEIPHEP